MQHEHASVDMLRHMLDNSKQLQEEFKSHGLSVEKDRPFIEELIMGKPGEDAPHVSIFCHFVELLYDYSFLYSWI